MMKKIAIGLLVSFMAVPLLPTTGLCWRGGPPSPYYGYRGYSGYHRHYGSGGWILGLGGLVLGTAIVASALQPPPPQVVYAAPPPPPVGYYSYRPAVSPGACRWERYVLDGYGRAMFDRYGQPIKEYTTGPCDYPPTW
ncbi:MAG: hypothetical protein FWG62_00065 [Proteobacteria bacterium]|nr:hypothetical protein [Pseudomonadota bacterium]